MLETSVVVLVSGTIEPSVVEVNSEVKTIGVVSTIGEVVSTVAAEVLGTLILIEVVSDAGGVPALPVLKVEREGAL